MYQRAVESWAGVRVLLSDVLQKARDSSGSAVAALRATVVAAFGGGAGAAAIVSLVTLISYSRCNLCFCSIIKMEQFKTIMVS